MNDALTTGEAARLLGVTPRRVQTLINTGRLAATKHGRDWLINQASLAAYRPKPQGRPR